MKEYIFDMSKVESLDDWWDLYVSTIQCPGSSYFGRNLDAYNDSLHGSPGCPELPCCFTFINMKKVDRDDVWEWTKQELIKRREKCHSSWIPIIEKEIELLEYHIGSTLHNWIIDPLIYHDKIDVVIKP